MAAILTRMFSSKMLRMSALLIVMPLFQNCGGSFVIQDAMETTSSSLATGDNISTSLDGKLLYAANCAECHQPLVSSTKLGKLAADIKGAIKAVPSMAVSAKLTGLNFAEIQAIEDALNGRSTTTTVTPDPLASTPVGQCLPTAIRGVSKSGVRRLSRDELMATMRGLFPQIYDEIKPYFASYPDTDLVEDVDKYDGLHSQAQVLAWSNTIDAVISSMNNRGLLAEIGGECLRAASISESCWRSFFTNFGKKAYRRPLVSTELEKLVALTMAQPSSTEAIYAAFNMLLRSPAYLFHFEVGVSEENSRVRLSDYEVANRISFAILGTPPDAALLAAADQGALKSLAQVEAQVNRLIESEGAKTKLKKFFSEWLELSKIQTPQQEYMAFFKNYGNGGGFDITMRQEIEDFVFHIIWKKKGSFRDLMTAPISFPRFMGWDYSKGAIAWSPLSGIYGGDPYRDFTPEGQVEANPYPAPNNPGLLTRAGFMSTTRWETSPINRGVFVQRRILCEALPSPDFAAVNQRLADVGTLDPLTMAGHQIVTAKTAGVACAACHSKINPVGFALEAYDMIGAFRTKEQVLDITKFYSEKHGVVATHNLPNPISNVILGEKTVTVSSPFDLAEQVATSTRAQLCLGTFVLRHFDRRKENSGDSCALSEITKTLGNDKPVLGLFVKSLANEDIFWRRK